MPKARERVIEAVRELPDDATVEDAMERLYVLAKIEKGLKQADSGQTVSHEEAKSRIFGWPLSGGRTRQWRTFALSASSSSVTLRTTDAL